MAEKPVWTFGVFEADPASGELRKHGVRVKLHAQPFQVLVMLLERPADIVTREEMRQRIWGNDTFVDFDHSLNSAVNKIRDALNDSASQPRYVETVPGKGYRFIAPVSKPSSSSESAPGPPRPPGDTRNGSPSLLSTPEELPPAPRERVRLMLFLVQILYLSFYLTALANLKEAQDVFAEAQMFNPGALTAILVATAAALIPIRLYIGAALAFDLRQLPAKFKRLFPPLLALDLLWALSPFLLAHYISAGFALGLAAVLVYLPFAQRSLVLMYERED